MNHLREQDFFIQQPIYTALSDVPIVTPHTHDFIEIFYVINGTAQHLIKNERIDLNAGDLYIVRPNVCHQFTSKDSSPLLHRNFLVKSSEFERICEFVKPGLFQMLMQREGLLKTTVSMHVINNFEKQLELFVGMNPLHSIIIEILDVFVNDVTQAKHQMPIWLQEMLVYLGKPQSFTKSIADLTKDLHLSPAYICTAFKKHVGVSMTQYLLDAKLQYAYSLLLSSGLSIGSIAEQCGFNSIPYFYKEFKNKYNIVPGSLRKQSKQNDKK